MYAAVQLESNALLPLKWIMMNDLCGVQANQQIQYTL